MAYKKLLRQLAAAAALFTSMLHSASSFAVEQKTYSVGVVPQYSEVTIHHQWTPVLEYLGRKTHSRMKLRLFKSIAEFETAIRNGEVDFAYMNPYQVVLAKKNQGYRPLIRDNKHQLRGILVTRKDTGLKNLQDLKDKKIAFPSPNAFAASLYIRALLREKEKISIQPVFARTHSNAIRMVLLGKTSAAGVVQRTMNKQRLEVRNNLSILYTTPGVPAHPFAAHSRVPENFQKLLTKAFLDMRNTETGRKLLQGISIEQPFEADYEMDYQRLETLKLEYYLQPE